MSNQNHLWFRAKKYGWGWTPSTWQGWLVIVVYAGAITASGALILHPHAGMTSVGPARWIAYAIALTVESASLFLICMTKGEKPHWQWGEKKTRV